jgi:alkanesulfonate monooxygenase SsuD/methylene tetrahydromethanopterin reductase-like flavin-dependent oxidoreductase (luciferase family)
MRTIMYADVADPPLLVDLAVRAEQRSWDGVFLWDHILWKSPVRAVADAWVALSAIAAGPGTSGWAPS